jgi:protein subunit release factor B
LIDQQRTKDGTRKTGPESLNKDEQEVVISYEDLRLNADRAGGLEINKTSGSGCSQVEPPL